MAIKRKPEDFVVEERLTEQWLRDLSEQPRPFALYRLTKKGRATPEAVSGMARKLGIPQGAIAYAGLKDKHAQSVQHVTVCMKRGKACVEAAESRGEG